MSFKLPDLPFPKDSLAPYLSQETIEYHYGKHHRGYIEKLNKIIEGKAEENKSLEEIIKTASGGLFNNAAQAWNHNFYWNCLSAKAKKRPGGKLSKMIDKAFGSFEEFKSKFKESALSNFGSGWTWLVKKSNGNLEIINTSNAGNPITNGDKPLLTCDVWEHAYYIDYRNERGKYLDNFWNIVNWDFVETQND
ncbi:MAG: superoxide dismutase [Coxiella sp. DG_40]|nr:MAG: superoxide dismutase [Coxiella sp. DG_40]